jgi:hypothetical protein
MDIHLLNILEGDILRVPLYHGKSLPLQRCDDIFPFEVSNTAECAYFQYVVYCHCRSF